MGSCGEVVKEGNKGMDVIYMDGRVVRNGNRRTGRQRQGARFEYGPLDLR